MPLVNSPALAPKKLVANRANAQLWRGPITLEGLIRVRDRNIEHGAYAQDTEEALRMLGEEPKDFLRVPAGGLDPAAGRASQTCF